MPSPAAVAAIPRAVAALKSTLAPTAGASGVADIYGYLANQAKERGGPVYKEDRFWAGGLAGCAIFMMYYFF